VFSTSTFAKLSKAPRDTGNFRKLTQRPNFAR